MGGGGGGGGGGGACTGNCHLGEEKEIENDADLKIEEQWLDVQVSKSGLQGYSCQEWMLFIALEVGFIFLY